MVGPDKYWFEQDDSTETSLTDTTPEVAPETVPEPDPAQPAPAENEDFNSVFDGNERPVFNSNYQSNFAKRACLPENNLNDKGKIKTLRGSMLKKLLKYDFKALFKYMVPCYIVLGAASVFVMILSLIMGGVDYSSTEDSRLIMVLLTIFMSILTLAAQVVTTVGTIACVTRFYRNLYSSEGYLTLSIPATPTEHLFSKIISSVTIYLLSFAATFISQAIAFIPSGGLDSFLNQNIIGQIFYLCENTSLPVLAFIEVLLLALLAELFSLQLFYTCISLGQLVSSKNRIAAAIGFYFLFSFVGTILVAVFFVSILFDVLSSTQGELTGLINLFSTLGGHGVVWLCIILLAALNVGEFFIVHHILKKKVNLA